MSVFKHLNLPQILAQKWSFSIWGDALYSGIQGLFITLYLLTAFLVLSARSHSALWRQHTIVFPLLEQMDVYTEFPACPITPANRAQLWGCFWHFFMVSHELVEGWWALLVNIDLTCTIIISLYQAFFQFLYIVGQNLAFNWFW